MAPQLRDVVLVALYTVTGRDPRRILDTTTLGELGIDSLMLTSLLLEIEDLLGFELPLEVLSQAAETEKPEVVGDLIRLLATVAEPLE